MTFLQLYWIANMTNFKPSALAFALTLAGAMSAQAAPVSYTFSAEVSALSAFQDGTYGDVPTPQSVASTSRWVET